MKQFLLLLMAGLKEASYHIHESLCHPLYLELSSIKKFEELPKLLKLVNLLKTVSLVTRLWWLQKCVCLKTLEVYFIKWTTSGVPPMGLRNPLEGYVWRNKQELSDRNSQKTCTWAYLAFSSHWRRSEAGVTNVALFGSDRRSRNANVCPSGTNLSKTLNLHHSRSDL